MGIEVNITAADIDGYVKEALLKTAFGSLIENAIKECVGKSYNNPIDSAMASYVHEIASELIRTKYSSKIALAVNAEDNATLIRKLRADIEEQANRIVSLEARLAQNGNLQAVIEERDKAVREGVAIIWRQRGEINALEAQLAQAREALNTKTG